MMGTFQFFLSLFFFKNSVNHIFYHLTLKLTLKHPFVSFLHFSKAFSALNVGVSTFLYACGDFWYLI